MTNTITEPSSEPEPAPQERVPFVSDCAARRYRIFSFDFDSRASALSETLDDTWDEGAKTQFYARRDDLIASIKSEYGERHLERKVADFGALGTKPFSIVSYHNELHNHVRTAFVAGAYYSALTGACALGERILNHMILDLREHYKNTPEYKKVFKKQSFDNWDLVISALTTWKVLLPIVTDAFQKLKVLRNRSLHFNPETATNLRADAFEAMQLLGTIIANQFSGFGAQPWFILGTMGAMFIKQEWESDPFVRNFYVPRASHVGIHHGLEFTSVGWIFVDHPDYAVFEIESLTDEEFADAFNNRDPALMARLFPDPAIDGASD